MPAVPSPASCTEYDRPSAPPNSRWRRRFLLLLLLVTLAACAVVLATSGDFERALPNGHVLYRTNAHSVFIADARRPHSLRIVVPPCIRPIGRSGHFVYGRTAFSGDSDVPSRAGYFILDTRSGNAETALDERTWNDRLRELGISERSALRTPESFRFVR
jgi:hypothetical protein